MFKILCNIHEIRDKILEKMEANGILWVTGEKPTNSPPSTPLWLCVNDDVLTYMPKRYITSIPYREITPEEYLSENKEGGTEMKKSYLKTGYIVTTRNGEEYMVFSNIDLHGYNANSVIVGNNNYEFLYKYTEDLLNTDYPSGELDIVKVERVRHPNCLLNIEYRKSERQVLWERKEPKEMTMEELEKLLGYPVKIVK